MKQLTVTLGNQELTYTLHYKKIKRLNLSIKSGEVFVSAPIGMPLEEIHGFMREKQHWIQSKLSQSPKAPPITLSIDDPIYYLGKAVPLSIISGKNQVILNKHNLVLSVTDPNNFSLKAFTLDQFFHRQFLDLAHSLNEEIYPLFQSVVPDSPILKTKKMTSRWGSCHPQKKIITLNQKLIHTPLHCIRYVLYHEYVHFIHPNHSTSYYQELAKYVPDYEEQRAYLKQYSNVYPY